MSDWINDTLTTGAVATAATTLAIAAMGKLEDDNAIAPFNAVSHIVYGEAAAKAENVDVRHTVTGMALNAVAVTAWAGMHELMMPRSDSRTFQRAMLTGAAVSAIAYLTDYHVVPQRLTPGFEKRLSTKSLFAVYATLAASLAFGSLFGCGTPRNRLLD